MVLNSKRAIYYQIIKSHFGEVVLAELDIKIIFLEFIDSNLEQTMANLELL